MAKLTLDNIGNFTSATVTTINTNSDRIEAALEKTLSRDGTTPNQMEADLDLNHHDLLNVEGLDVSDLTIAGEDIRDFITSIVEDIEISSTVLPTSADTWLRRNAGNTAFQALTDDDVRATLNISEDIPTRTSAAAYTPSVAPEYIQTRGYTTVGDGGQALYKKVAVEPSHAGKFSITLSGGGTVWYELAEKIIRPQMFGAVGDGVTDDGLVLNTVAAAMSAGFFKTLHINQKFLHNQASSFVISAVDDIVIYGDGRDTCSLISGDNTGARPFIARNIDGLYVSGIEFLSLNANAACNNFELQNVNQGTVEKCRFKDSTNYGLGVYEDTGGGPAGTCNDIVVRFNEFINNGIFGLEPFPKVKSNHCEVYGNYFEHVGFDQAGLGGDPACLKPVQGYETALVHHNVLYDCGNGGIWFGMGDHYEVRNNQIWDCKGVALAMTIIEHILFPPGEITFQSAIIEGNTVGYSSGFANVNSQMSISATNTLNGYVHVLRNKFVGGALATDVIRIQTTVAIPNLVIEENDFIDPPQTVFYCDAAAGAAPTGMVFRGNRIFNRNLALATVGRVSMTAAANPKVIGNYFKNVGNQAILFGSCTGTIEIEDNIIDGYNVANTASVAAINITDAVANTYSVRRNILKTGNGNPKALLNVGTVPTIIMDGNVVPTLIPIVLVGTPTIKVDATIPWTNYGRARWFYGTAAPVAGTHGTGDLVWNTSPAASGNIGWVCTLGGTPGTWKTFGTIAA